MVGDDECRLGSGGRGWPELGGVFTDELSWRWCWWINLPCAALSFAGLFGYLDVRSPRTPLFEGLKAVD